jgi:hypothetical protein
MLDLNPFWSSRVDQIKQHNSRLNDAFYHVPSISIQKGNQVVILQSRYTQGGQILPFSFKTGSHKTKKLPEPYDHRTYIFSWINNIRPNSRQTNKVTWKWSTSHFITFSVPSISLRTDYYLWNSISRIIHFDRSNCVYWKDPLPNWLLLHAVFVHYDLYFPSFSARLNSSIGRHPKNTLKWNAPPVMNTQILRFALLECRVHSADKPAEKGHNAQLHRYICWLRVKKM